MKRDGITVVRWYGWDIRRVVHRGSTASYAMFAIYDGAGRCHGSESTLRDARERCEQLDAMAVGGAA